MSVNPENREKRVKNILETADYEVTECKKAETILKDDEELYRTLCDNNGDGFILLEPLFNEQGEVLDFRFLKVNRAYESQTGRSAAVVEGKRAREVAPELELEWISIVGRVAKSGKSACIEKYNQRTSKWYDAHYFPWAKSQIGIFFRDTTERKKAEELLDKKQRELDCILDSSPTIIFYKDKEGKFIQANRAFGEALKMPKEQLLGKTVFDLYSAEIAQGMTNDDLEVMKSKRPKIGIVEPYDSQTGLRWIRTSKIPSFDENGDVTGLIGFSEDITERKKAEDNLEQSMINYQDLLRQSNAQKEELETIFDSLPSQGLYKDKDDRILKVNKAFADFMHTSKKDVEGKPLCNFFTPEIIQKCREDDKEVIETGQTKKGILDRYETANGVNWFLTEKVPYKDKDGNVIGTISFSTDTTNLKNLERQLQEQERLATIGATAGMVGHDIRNPLQAMVSDVYLLKDFLTAIPEMPIKNEVAESLESLEQNISYINKIVADLQDYARPLRPDFANVDLSEVMANVVSDLWVSDNIGVNLSSNTFVKIRTDPTYIRRILTNLVNNAVQAMPNGGFLELTCIVKEDKVFVTVADTGMGIPEDVKPKLFSPMMTTKAKGQGLGLAVVKRLVEALDGTINFESQEGKGTTFTIEFPLTDSEFKQ